MPKVALADTLMDWDLLIRAARKKVDAQPELAAVLDQLEEKLARVKALDVERQALEARRQEAKQELNRARDEGKDLASRARSFLKGVMKPSDERLLEFRVRPRRPYGRRKPKPDANG
jgi:CHASE3 domain sensor protein